MTMRADETSRSLRAMVAGDQIDARAMMAIEVRKEREYRINGPLYAHPSTPADRVDQYGDTALREEVEAQNGEPLL
jgi:hypothetical protein